MSKIFDFHGVPTIKPQDVKSMSDYALIDVRRDDEYSGELGHVEGAKLVTLGEDLKHFLDSMKPESKIIFICRSGGRSAQATLYAQNMGFDDVVNMQGGMLEWNELGLPTVK
jgi:hydroxyacylglutathione hydrolase